MIERSIAVCHVLPAATLLLVSVERSAIHGRDCSTIAFARLMNWKRTVAPIEAPPFISSQNVSSSVPVMPQ